MEERRIRGGKGGGRFKEKEVFRESRREKEGEGGRWRGWERGRKVGSSRRERKGGERGGGRRMS